MPKEPDGFPPPLPASEPFIKSNSGKIIDHIINELINHVEILDKRVRKRSKIIKNTEL